MNYTENLWLFFVLLFGIIAVPGMDMLFVLANALTGGSNRGLAATAGIMLGGAVHTLNGTATAVGRTIIALIENRQEADGSFSLPSSLQRYGAPDRITAR